MIVSNATKEVYNNTSAHKQLHIYFPDIDLTVDHGQICKDSMHLSESLIEGKNVEFVGCIASLFEIQLYGISQDIKGQYMEASITAEDTEEIPLFHGVVDSALKQTNKNYKNVVAYDVLYTKGNTDVASWYNSLPFPVKLKYLRDSLFSYIGIVQEDITLPNDDVIINKEYAPTSLQAIVVIKSICQINGAFGIINRSGNFEYRILADLSTPDGAYPGATLFPPFYPGIGSASGGENSVAESIGYYKKVDYEEFSVKPVEKVTVRQTDSVAGASYGEGNNYIVQGNMFTLNKSDDELLSIAQNIHKSIAGVEFTPFKSSNNGYPYLECGVDGISCYVYDYEKSIEEAVYTEKVFHIFKRELSGIQALRDSYSVQGEEYQQEFITDLKSQIEVVKNSITQEVTTQIKNVTYTREEIAEKYYTKEEVQELIKKALEEYWQSVESLPDGHEDTDNWYVVRGETVVE